MRHTIEKLPHIAGYTVFCQLIICGIQWPILMAWGYALHPLSIIGNLLFTPFVFALIAISSCICIGHIFTTTCAPLYAILRYIIDVWMYLFSISIPACEINVAQPHWSILVAIPVTTYAIAWHIRGVWRASAVLCIFFLVTGLSISYTQPYQHITWIHPHIVCAYIGDKTWIIHVRKHQSIRYSQNWVTYHLTPRLRQQYGVDHCDYLVTPDIQSRTVQQAHKAGIVKIGHIRLTSFLYTWYKRQQHCRSHQLSY